MCGYKCKGEYAPWSIYIACAVTYVLHRDVYVIIWTCHVVSILNDHKLDFRT